MYVYITTPNAGKNDNDLHTVGHYAPDGKWIPESDHNTDEQAAERVNYLNGGQEKVAVIASLCEDIRQLRERCTALEDPDINPYILTGDDLAKAEARAKSR